MSRDKVAVTLSNRHWAHRGEMLGDLHHILPSTTPVGTPAADEIIARVEAVSICSSDVKVIRLGAMHPLFSNGSGNKGGTVLGHEICLRVHSVGNSLCDIYHPGQRLGLQPAVSHNGRRWIIGMDLPGGFAQYLRLDRRTLDKPHVFNVPEALTAAEIALLEPYGCVERAWGQNTRQQLNPEGRALIVTGPGGVAYTSSKPLSWAEVTCIGPVPTWLADPKAALRVDDLSGPDGRQFDDIIAIGELPAATLSELARLLAKGGMLLQARRMAADGPVFIDPARVHYDFLAFTGTNENDILTALAPERQRFDTVPGGTALVMGAGGAMGRIHAHRLLQLKNGPATLVATSRKGQRLDDLRNDFSPLANAHGRNLLVVEDAALNDVACRLAPQGFDDITVVAPSAEAAGRAAGMIAPNGLFSVFAGTPYGSLVPFDLTRVATDGIRLTGSSGCTVGDMQDVLQRILSGELSLLANIKAVAGLDALPAALHAVLEGQVSGKIVIYPHAPDMPLKAVDGRWSKDDEAELTG